ncbi:hypothetical protein LTS18_008267, partial [Coniosporium uncinatum]
HHGREPEAAAAAAAATASAATASTASAAWRFLDTRCEHERCKSDCQRAVSAQGGEQCWEGAFCGEGQGGEGSEEGRGHVFL